MSLHALFFSASHMAFSRAGVRPRLWIYATYLAFKEPGTAFPSSSLSLSRADTYSMARVSTS